MAKKEMKNATPTKIAGEKVDLVTTATTISQAVEALTGFQGYRFLNLTTFRKNGVPVVTTVLFALANDKIYIWTTKDSGKVKRIRKMQCRSHQVRVWAGHAAPAPLPPHGSCRVRNRWRRSS